MPFLCSICGEESTRICVRCTKDSCGNHLCERCHRCSDCCECQVALDGVDHGAPSGSARAMLRAAVVGSGAALELGPEAEMETDLEVEPELEPEPALESDSEPGTALGGSVISNDVNSPDDGTSIGEELPPSDETSPEGDPQTDPSTEIPH